MSEPSESPEISVLIDQVATLNSALTALCGVHLLYLDSIEDPDVRETVRNVLLNIMAEITGLDGGDEEEDKR